MSEEITRRKCETCSFFLPYQQQNWDGGGVCIVSLPPMLEALFNSTYRNPATHADRYCGLWKEKEKETK